MNHNLRENDVDLRKRGRPKAVTPRNNVIKIRVTDEERFYLDQLADHYSMNVSSFIRWCIKSKKDEALWNGYKLKKFKK